MRWLLRLWRLLPDQFRLFIVKSVQRNRRLYRWLMFRHVDAKDRVDGTRDHLPPAALRYSVGASPHAEEFVIIGKICAADLQSALLKVGREIGSFSHILDFGCGCGRTLVHLKSLAPNAQIAGSDIDADAIEWCRQHLDFATFTLNREIPPSGLCCRHFRFHLRHLSVQPSRRGISISLADGASAHCQTRWNTLVDDQRFRWR